MNQNRDQRLFVKLFKSLAPGRAAEGDFDLNSYNRCNYSDLTD